MNRTLLTFIVISIFSFNANALDYPDLKFKSSNFGRSDSDFKPKELDMGKFYGDTLLYRAMAAIRKFHQNEVIRLNQYVLKNNPSKEYILEARLNLIFWLTILSIKISWLQ